MLKHRAKIYLKGILKKIIFIIGDAFALIFSFYIAYHIREVLYNSGLLSIPSPEVEYFYPYWYLLLFHILFLFIFDIYRMRYPFWIDVREIIKAILAGTVSIFFVLALLKISQEVSRFIILSVGFISLFAIPLLKALLKLILFKINLWQADVLVIAKPDADFESFTENLNKNWYVGYRLSHLIDVDSLHKSSLAEFLNNENLEKVIKEKNIVLPILYKLDKNEFYDIFIKMDTFFEDIKLLPDLHSLFVNNLRIENDGSILLINFENNLLRYNNRVLQYVFNKLASVVIFILLLPLLVVLGLLVLLDSRGPVIYKARRIGYSNTDFYVYKFRTMYQDADKKLKDLLDSNPEFKSEFERDFKLRDDPRITRIGRFLRRTSLDELPQLINVLKGEMNLVGPRPIVRDEIKKYGSAFDELIKIKPGITGLWQVSGRNDLDYEKRVELDLFYIKNWSLWMDIMILMKTFFIVIKSRGAY